MAKQTTTVYRIEHSATGGGMYRCYEALGLQNCPTYEIEREAHPIPFMDSLLMDSIPEAKKSIDFWSDFLAPSRDFSYGFGSVEQLRRWLFNDEWLKWLHDAGYVLAIIKAEEVYVGHTQAVFIKPAKYQKRNIKNFFKL